MENAWSALPLLISLTAMPAGALQRPVRLWEPDYESLQRASLQTPGAGRTAFLAAAETFLANEGFDPSSVDVELRNLGPAGSWRALANVSVNCDARGHLSRQLAFESDYWLDAARPWRFNNHRWAKVMWHEMHHLEAFPVNLRRANDLAKRFAPAAGHDFQGWKDKWIKLLEPMEEMAADQYCIERYQAAFGPLTPELLRDSRGDMRKHAARYQQLLAGLLAEVKDPAAVRQAFPSALPIDSDGTILAQPAPPPQIAAGSIKNS